MHGDIPLLIRFVFRMSDTANTSAIQLCQHKTKDSITEYNFTFYCIFKDFVHEVHKIYEMKLHKSV
jgi:hypothetical protein